MGLRKPRGGNAEKKQQNSRQKQIKPRGKDTDNRYKWIEQEANAHQAWSAATIPAAAARTRVQAAAAARRCWGT